jgi:hypothetical protein
LLNKIKKIDTFILLSIVLVLVCNSFFPLTVAAKDAGINIKGFDRGVSWKPVIPIKKVTFVNFDENS